MFPAVVDLYERTAAECAMTTKAHPGARRPSDLWKHLYGTTRQADSALAFDEHYRWSDEADGGGEPWSR
jgi:hypothetical protein